MGDIYDWELEEKTADGGPAISVGAIPDELLHGYRTKPQGQGEPRRHSIVGEPFETRNPYHQDGTISFADVFEQPDRVNIGYVSTAPEHRGQGHASALMRHVYDSYPDKPIVWGQRMDDAAEHMFQQYRKEMPERTSKTAGAGENWVYFRHKDWPEAQVATGAQPHHILIHKVHDGDLDGDPILGNLSNTWAAGNGTAKGHEHDVARGVYDKKGRPQIWESNVDRNHVWDTVSAALGPKTAARAEEDTYALMTRRSQGHDAPWDITSIHVTAEEAQAAQTDENQRVVMFPRGEEVHPLGYYKRISSKAGWIREMERQKRENPEQYAQMGSPCPNCGRKAADTETKGCYKCDPIERTRMSADRVPMPKLEDDGGYAYEKLVCSHCYSDDLRDGKCYDCGSDDQYDTFMVYDQGNPVGFNNMDGTMIPYTPQPRDTQHEARGYNKSAEEMYAEIQGKGWTVESQGPKGEKFSVTITNPQGSRVERQGNTQEQALASALTWVWQHSHMSMDLPITPRTTLGQVFSKLRPSEADGRHLGMQAYTLKYTRDELQTFLEFQEADGAPRGWRVFKDAAITAYASRGWKVEGGLQLVMWNALTGQKGGPQVNSLQEGIALAERQMQNTNDAGQQIIYRAQIIDPMFPNAPKWDTDDTTLKGAEKKDNPYGWELGKEIPIQRSQTVPVEEDWAFSTRSSEERKPDFTFVYYQGALEMEEWSANSRPADMLKRILDLGGKDITDNNVDDNNMASGDVYKRDGEIDVELTNLADEDVQTKALDSVQQWAQGMNLIGPIQPHA